MREPKYKKITPAEKRDDEIQREFLPEKVLGIASSYFRVFCIVVGFGFLLKGIIGIIWRETH